MHNLRLRCQLIERGKQISLTEAGRLLYEQSLHIVKDMERLQSSLSDLAIGEAGSVRIGVADPTASYRLPRILSGFLAQYPKIKVSVEVAGTVAISELLLRGELDLAVCSAPEHHSILWKLGA
jgi:DNA-binding transcriptional LysR family regulator